MSETKTKGHISQIIGPVVDVFFEVSHNDEVRVLPSIHDALSRPVLMARYLSLARAKPMEEMQQPSSLSSKIPRWLQRRGSTSTHTEQRS